MRRLLLPLLLVTTIACSGSEEPSSDTQNEADMLASDADMSEAIDASGDLDISPGQDMSPQDMEVPQDMAPSNPEAGFTIVPKLIPDFARAHIDIPVEFALQHWCAVSDRECRKQVVIGFEGAPPVCITNGSPGSFPGSTSAISTMVRTPAESGERTLHIGFYDDAGLNCDASIAKFSSSLPVDVIASVNILASALNITTTQPSQDAVGVTFSERSLLITFDEPVDASDISPFVEVDASSDMAPVSHNVNATADQNTISIDLNDLREFKTLYTVTIKAGATSTTSHVLKDDFTLNFTSTLLFDDWYYTLHNSNLGGSVLLESAGVPFPISMGERVVGLDRQRWQFIPTSGDYYQLAPKGHPDRSVEGANGSATPSFVVAYGGSSGEQWTITPVSSNLWKLQNLNLGASKSLEGADGPGGTQNPFMANTSPSSGESWTLTRIEQIL